MGSIVEEHLLPYLVGLQLLFEKCESTGTAADFDAEIYSGFMLEIRGEWIFVTAGHCLEKYLKLLDSGIYDCRSVRFADFLHPDDESDTSVPVTIEDGWHLHQPENDIDYGFFRFSFLVKECLEERGVMAFTIPNTMLGPKFNFQFDVALLMGLPEHSSGLDKKNGVFEFTPHRYRVDNLQVDQHVVVGNISTDDSIVGVSGGPIIGVRQMDDGVAVVPVAVQGKWNREDTITAHRLDCVLNVIMEKYFPD